MNKECKHSVVIGKFYPFHAGHRYLIESALDFAEKVTVVNLMDFGKERESLFSINNRKIFLENGLRDLKNVYIVHSEHDLETDYNSDQNCSDFVDVIRKGMGKSKFSIQGLSPTHLCVSDMTYAHMLSQKLNLQCKVIARGISEYMPANIIEQDYSLRKLTPPAVSATGIRTKPFKYWEYINNDVKANFTIRVVFLGAESTGTTTLTNDMFNYLKNQKGVVSKVEKIPEWARKYLEAKATKLSGVSKIEITSEEIELFTREQLKLEKNTVSKTGCPMILCDTDAIASQAFHRFFFGQPSVKVEKIIEKNPPKTLYVVTSMKGIAFEPDTTRQLKDEREKMQKIFINELRERGLPYIIVSGTREERVKKTLKSIKKEIVRMHQRLDVFQKKHKPEWETPEALKKAIEENLNNKLTQDVNMHRRKRDEMHIKL